ncbi:MAG: diguanylate cyclase (GGDEF) domain-containing protein [Candidatus Nitrotoga sp. CP45]|nr:MAG: diguanylate cyclase (GGDEF) domain-containing protein [Candidatus Nitrotoga sp. CP45]
MSTGLPFGNCKEAKLQNTSFVQGHGALIGIDVHSQLICVCTENISEIFGLSPDKLLGQPANQVFAKYWGQFDHLASLEGRHQLGEIALPEGRPMTLIGHRQGDYMVLEIVHGAPQFPIWWNHIARTRFIDALAATNTIEQCVGLLVDTVFCHTGLDRVMCYRFLPGWQGEVIREACRPEIGGFMGLRFPASDVPANVRQLSTLNCYRMIADVDTKNVPLLYWTKETPPVDMTYSILRAVHPVHIQYLHNMGVKASLSLSLVINCRLWGLVACHHMAPLTLGIHECLALEEIAKLVSLHLKNLLGLIDQQHKSNLREKLSVVRGALQATRESPRSGLALSLGKLLDLFQANGIWLQFEGENYFAGLTPDQQSLSPLRDWLDLLPKDQVSQYHELPETFARHPALVRNACGVLYIPLSTSDYLVMLRQEIVHVVNWAGQPASLDENDSRSLTPRNSFATWAQEVRKSAEPWHDSEISYAETLRQELIDYISLSKLEQVALHDPLTGLANRLRFEKRLQQEVRHTFLRNSQFAVHMIDLDKFKSVNDTLGHAAGDALLQDVSQRLMQLARTEDTVARLGGDEFAVIQAGITNREAAGLLADRIVIEVAKPYELSGHKVEIGTSVGVAIFPVDSSNESEILKQADLALYAVKKAGRNAYLMYTPAMRESDERNLDATPLLDALAQNQLALFYQPIVDARNGELRGLESLIRWHHPQDGLLTAEQFMPLVKQLHLSATVNEWVLNAAFLQQKTWLAMGLPSVPITVNIGSSQFTSQDLLGQITNIAKKHDLGREWLRLDIKEDAILKDVNLAIQKLNTLRDGGVAAQLDNFGRGFVSLGFMTKLPFIGIKFAASALPIDKDNNFSLALISIMKGIAQVLGAKLIITRIETEASANWIRNQGIEFMQGYALGEPVQASQVPQLLAKHVKK